MQQRYEKEFGANEIWVRAFAGGRTSSSRGGGYTGQWPSGPGTGHHVRLRDCLWERTFPDRETNGFADHSIVFGRASDQIFTLLSKDDSKYDYYIFDSFCDVKEMNKVLKYP